MMNRDEKMVKVGKGPWISLDAYRKQRKQKCSYFDMCRQYPLRALATIAGCAFIFAVMFGLMYLGEIAGWIERWMR